ncbi:Competence protein F phosphoribosyltransferase domain - like protein; protein YhgH required for utilization of DNA as sole source of carbon and energy [Thioalkalivibrio nitratireducens DSM 14787]|uniref:Competence protein F phosphoribosyltransferase domain-like protein protein YhgH required for utilization of DNA as sole source of carbon and energy n=1 Tax=Thioalkalivibrio nitratireducens (strain DSM 14787 / UNIQEM 213 / ALEN2) TaxID=1255043 RepID=L0DSZ6_THIND|nr:Competence protein F phosphoribosyltransferase domain - like protein; protein YhgH required for utilization of DNA as sole source of carbon and energy [Thioalkalivibrio nitratireducens DSM 14787]
MLRRWAAACADGVVPDRCVLCRAPATMGVCTDCAADLVVPASPCPGCAQPLPAAGLCPSCLRAAPAFDAAWAPFAYAWPLDRLLLSYKGGSRPQLGRPLAGLFVRHLDPAATRAVDRVIPVPLHDGRLARRGFNQAERLALGLCRARGLELDTRSARRVLATPSQQGLGRRARRANLRKAFAVDADLSGLRVLLVDDVMTTGTTLDMLAREARRAGAAWVGAAALARA